MAADAQGIDLVHIVALLGAGVVAVPLFRRLGLGSVLGYFAAGLAIGPFGLGLISDTRTILHVAEFGVILLLFIIGLEMQPSRLWKLRGAIFGLGLTHVLVCGALLTGAGMLAGLPPAAAFVIGAGFVLSSTAVVMQLLDEWGETSTPQGQRIFSILLFEDLAIVPLLAIVAFIAPAAPDAAQPRWLTIAIALGAIAGLVAAGRWLLNPLFRLLAAARAREVMTAAALLVVLGSALLMQLGGLSMAMGAFLAGVLLSESVFRHQLEADIEPFRGILLGLFFLAVGMSLDLSVVAREWPLVLAAVAGFMSIAATGTFLVARLFGAPPREALRRASLFCQGGEFAFVLYGTAAASGLLARDVNAIFTAAVIVSMALTPVIASLVRRSMPEVKPALDGIEAADGLTGSILVIGFGRFGQAASQPLLARGLDVSIIENSVGMIRAAERFGFRVYYGDGTRLDVLRASGAASAEAILVCIDDRKAATAIAELVRWEFPMARLFVRAVDRGHALDLVHLGVDYQIRETFESAMKFGEAVLLGLGVPAEEVAAIGEDVRRRDRERFDLQLAGGMEAGTGLIRNNAPTPAPLTEPQRPGRVFGELPEEAAGDPRP
jgi:glutathione-regulated potassium-efflux system protein KefB